MSQYYFTVASLPALLYTHRPLITIEDFLDTCRQTLRPGDFQHLKKAVLADPASASRDIPLLRRWRSWELNLRNTLALMRAKAKGLSAFAYLQPVEEDFSARQTAATAFGEDSPLRAEEIIEKARWNFLTEQEATHYFDLERLSVYYLKLQLLHRKYAFDSARGAEKYSVIMQNYLDLLKTRENINV